jgi:hypothetical protein
MFMFKTLLLMVVVLAIANIGVYLSSKLYKFSKKLMIFNFVIVNLILLSAMIYGFIKM